VGSRQDVGVLVGSPIAQENNRGSGIKKKPLGQRGVSERSPRLYKTAFGFTERIQTSVKTRLFKIAHFLSRLFTPPSPPSGNQFPPWCAEATGQHMRFHVDVSVK